MFFIPLFRRSKPRQSPARSARLGLESLEAREVPATLRVLASPQPALNSYVNVGFDRNPVANVAVAVDGRYLTTPTSFRAEIDFGDGSGPKPGFVGISHKDKFGNTHFVVKGSHVYRQSGYKDIKVKISVGGQSETWKTCGNVARLMPSAASLPGKQPDQIGGPRKVAPVQMNVAPVPSPRLPTGAWPPLRDVGTLSGKYDGQIVSNPAEYSVRINWGDSPNWEKGVVVRNPRWTANNRAEQFILQGSHRYAAAGAYRIVLHVTGPDGQTSTTQVADAVAERPLKFLYQRDDVVARAGDGITPEQAMAALQANPHDLFPFDITGADGTLRPTIVEGGMLHLKPLHVIGSPVPVPMLGGNLQAVGVTPTSFTLVVRTDGYIVPVGSTISFETLRDSSGNVILRHTGFAGPDANPFGGFMEWANTHARNYLWPIQAGLLYAALHPRR